jgi:hypothetical protein
MGMQHQSEYARQAIEEKNRRIMEDRVRHLSQQLSAQSLAVNKAMEETMVDGLTDCAEILPVQG